ncbi:uncharacterized protein LOC123037984 isoform X2 [Drosophila rhopaloa]|uniref:DNA binding HTH domain-containing protein n=1 Tax=Drosophila rhopaloa TaxID=1041015 RepID=A0ABM5JE33_DRORH|nr:uncharacterized protein LOC123037984 isoform X2 [Drosophila rhopaloa]
MLLKTVDINGEQHLFTCFEEGVDKDITLYIHNTQNNVSYSETLAKDVFQQRLKTLNARVKFPEDAVRLALLKSDPSHAEFADSKHESSILSLKYSMVNTAVPLKWNWHLSPLNNAQFYREVCMNSVSTAGGLRDQVSFLIEVLRSKDKELKQFRTEGCKIFRESNHESLEVLDAIKNKRLEMKKAARILGVSYGTLYGRYREVYGCLKHPYSGTAFRNSGSTSASQLGVQPRFDLGFRNGGVLPAQLVQTNPYLQSWAS